MQYSERKRNNEKQGNNREIEVFQLQSQINFFKTIHKKKKIFNRVNFSLVVKHVDLLLKVQGRYRKC